MCSLGKGNGGKVADLRCSQTNGGVHKPTAVFTSQRRCSQTDILKRKRHCAGRKRSGRGDGLLTTQRLSVPVLQINSARPLSYSVLVSVSAFIALSTVFHSINSPDNSPLSHSALLVLFLWSFQLCTSSCESPSALT